MAPFSCSGPCIKAASAAQLLSGPGIFKLLNLCGNQHISIPQLLMSLFLLFLWKIFIEDFYSPLYHPLYSNCRLFSPFSYYYYHLFTSLFLLILFLIIFYHKSVHHNLGVKENEIRFISNSFNLFSLQKIGVYHKVNKFYQYDWTQLLQSFPSDILFMINHF